MTIFLMVIGALLFTNGFIWGRIYEMRSGIYRRAYEAANKLIDELFATLTEFAEKHPTKEEKEI